MLKAYSQKDKRWASKTLGKTKVTMGESGCFVVSLAILAEMTPDATLEVLNRNQAFNHNGLLLSDLAAKALGLKYSGKSKTPPKTECVAETNYYAPKFPQHFFVWSPNGLIIDPLSGKSLPNPYPVVSYRLFQQKKPAEVKPEANKTIVKPAIERQMTLWEKIIAWICSVFK